MTDIPDQTTMTGYARKITPLLHPGFVLVAVIIGLGGTSLAQHAADEPSALYWIFIGVVVGAPIVAGLTIVLLQAAVAFKHVAMGIKYVCPTCSEESPPLLRCHKCDSLMHDLTPSVFGILWRRCENCGVWHGTLECLRITELEPVCRNPKCQLNLEHGDLGHLPEYRFAISGAPSSGKTALRVAAIRGLVEEFAPLNDYSVRFLNKTEKETYERMRTAMEEGVPLEQTLSRSVPKAFTLSLTTHGGDGCLLYIYDAAGEDQLEEDRLSMHPVEKYAGIMFVIDPLAEVEIRDALKAEGLAEEIQAANPASAPAHDALGTLINVIEETAKVAPDRSIEIPIAIVVTKMDACELHKRCPLTPEFESVPFEDLAVANYFIEQASVPVEAFVRTSAMNELLSLFQRFGTRRFFAVSAMGFQNANGAKRQQPGAFTPLLWLLYRAGAISDYGRFDRWFINFHKFAAGALRGRHGAECFLLYWGLLLGATSIFTFSAAKLELIQFVCCGGLHAIAFGVIYLSLYCFLILGRPGIREQ